MSGPTRGWAHEWDSRANSCPHEWDFREVPGSKIHGVLVAMEWSSGRAGEVTS